MKEIYYPDGTMGLVRKNPQNTSRHTLVTTIAKNKLLKIDVLLKQVGTKNIVDTSDNKKMKDKNGKKVIKTMYDKSTGSIISKGTAYKYINSDKKEVKEKDIVYYIDGSPVKKFDKMNVVDIKKYIPAAKSQEYIFTREYEVIPKTKEDVKKLWEFAKYMSNTESVSTSTIIIQDGWQKYGVVFIPIADNKTFSVLAKLTQKRIKFKEPIKTPEGK